MLGCFITHKTVITISIFQATWRFQNGMMKVQNEIVMMYNATKIKMIQDVWKWHHKKRIKRQNQVAGLIWKCAAICGMHKTLMLSHIYQISRLALYNI